MNLPAIATPTFGVNVSGTGKYANDAVVTLASLVLNGTAFTNGTYTYASFSAAQQAFLLNNGGTITVRVAVDDVTLPAVLATTTS